MPLASFDTPVPVGHLTGTFDAVAVTQIRATAIGQGGTDPYFQIAELEVYLTAGQTVLLTDGYDYLRDVTTTSTGSTNSVAWANVAGTGNDLKDINFQSHVKALDLSPLGGNRAFLTYSFVEPVPVNQATLGGYHGQYWANWELYTANGDTMPPLQSLAASDSQTIQDAGWTLQHVQVAGEQADSFVLANPGDYKYVAVVWNVQGGAEVELELRGAFTGPKVAMFVVSDQSTGSTLVTNEALVNVAITTDPTDAVGMYLITDTADQPFPDDPGWAGLPSTFAIMGAEREVTLHAWFKDDATGSINGKDATILYSTAVPVVSNIVITATPGDPTSATVAWDTSIAAEGSVIQKPIAAGATETTFPDPENELRITHSVLMTGLTEGVNNKVTIVNSEVVGPTVYWLTKWPILGDANMDCQVNILDLIFIRNKLNQDPNSGNNWQANVNNDTAINILDLIYVRNKLNTRCP